MSARRMPVALKTTLPPSPERESLYWPVFWWAVLVINSLFFWYWCLDRFLVPRFLFLSAVLLAGTAWQLFVLPGRRFRSIYLPDLWMVGWYGINVAAVSWAFSWSEAVFFSQKVLLLLATSVFIQQALDDDGNRLRRSLSLGTEIMAAVTILVLTVQVGQAVQQYGLDNDHLYAYAKGLSGNKGLASDFLFFTGILLLIFRPYSRLKKWTGWLLAAMLVLILVLQTRTVYLALLAAAVWAVGLKVVLEPGFRPVFLKRVLPAALLGLALLVGLVVWKGNGTSLAERLNPATYLNSVSANERRLVWYKTDQLNKLHPWLGVGNGSWKFYFPSMGLKGGYRMQERDVVFTRVHNDYLEIRSEMGYLGALWFIGLFICAFAGALWVLFHPGTAPQARDEVLLLSAGLVGYGVIQYFDFPRERIEMQVVLGIFLGWTAFHATALWKRLPNVPVSAGLGKTALLLMAAGLLWNVVIGYHRVTGEIHNVKALRALAAGKHAETLREAQAAGNAYYEYNDVALPLAWYEGIAHYRMKNPEGAVEAMERAYRLNPWSFHVLNNYASALGQQKRFRDAVPIYERAIDINPSFDEGKFNLAYSYLTLGDTAAAKYWVSRVDTIAHPQSPEERSKNEQNNLRRAQFEKWFSGAH